MISHKIKILLTAILNLLERFNRKFTDQIQRKVIILWIAEFLV